MNLLKLLLISLLFSSCVISQPKYRFYYSPSMEKKTGIQGYCKVGDKVFPATHIIEHRLIRKDALLVGTSDTIYLTYDKTKVTWSK